jgi:parallel beta-helix repeat protein
VEKDNIVVDGVGHTLYGSGNLTTPWGQVWYGPNVTTPWGEVWYNPTIETALSLLGRTNVSIQDLKITGFVESIILSNSSYCVIQGNAISNCGNGLRVENSPHTSIEQNDFSRIISLCLLVDIMSNETIISANRMTSSDRAMLIYSSNNTISGNVLGTYDGINILFGMYNTIVGNTQISGGVFGIELYQSSFNIISRNNIVKNERGIHGGTNNTIFENNIQENGIGIDMAYNCSIYRNNFINNTKHVDFVSVQAPKQFSIPAPNANLWDNGTQGNYWSDYQAKYPNAKEADNSGTYDTPYVPYPDNIDNHPLVKPVEITQPSIPSWIILVILPLPIIVAIAVGLFIYFKKRKR